MKSLFVHAIQRILIIFRQPISWLLFRHDEKISQYHVLQKNKTLSGMVHEFNYFNRLIYFPFFRRVEFLSEDIAKIKNIQGPIVFVMKNRGQLEYRYINYLFLKEKVHPIVLAKGCHTIFWQPLKSSWQYVLCLLDDFYKKHDAGTVDGVKDDKQVLQQGKNILVNLSISRDYLFGLIRTNPLHSVKALLELQAHVSQPIHVMTVQFLYDKHPDKTELSYFDLLFGEKSQPGAIRKFILFVMNYHRKPRVKFGTVLSLNEFATAQSVLDVDAGADKLLRVFEEDLRIEKARVTGPKLKPKEVLLREIMGDPVFLEKIRRLADKEDVDYEAYKRQAQKYLYEIAADVNYSYLHFIHITLRHVWNKIFNGVVVKHDQLNRVREMAGKNPIVLVPMHRSHIDYMLISDIFYEHNITFPYVCAGINLNFWPVGRLIRKCGGFFIRRHFRGNKVYSESMYTYVKQLLQSSHCLEFFIEGTRSRTGKQLKPKMGFLNMIVRAYFEKVCDDICFVPISVTYDQILEQKAYQSEGVGAEKQKENAHELLKVRKIFHRKYGKVYIEFAEPVSFKQYCLEQQIKNQNPRDDYKKDVEELALFLTNRITDNALVTPVSLVALAILSLKQKTFQFEKLLEQISLLKVYLDSKKVTYSDLIQFDEQYAYHEAVKKLCSRGLLKKVDTFEGAFYTFEDKHRFDFDYYKNNIIHFYVLLTLFCKILGQQEFQKPVTVEAVIKQLDVLKTLFHQDFVFETREVLSEQLKAVLVFCEQMRIVDYDQDTQTFTRCLEPDGLKAFVLFHGLLDSFLEAQIVVLRYLKYNEVNEIEKKNLIKDILQKAKPMYLREDLYYPEALSRFNLENTFQTFVDLGILRVRKDDHHHALYSLTDDQGLLNTWTNSIRAYLEPGNLFTAVAGAVPAITVLGSTTHQPKQWQH